MDTPNDLMPKSPSFRVARTLEGYKYRLLRFAYRIAATGILSGRHFNRNLPDVSSLRKSTVPLRLEIVSHCWNYSHFLIYQLSSIAIYAPKQCLLTVTIFYSTEDSASARLLGYFNNLNVNRVKWNFVSLPKESLFRRAIGRNMAAIHTVADWIWFTDCDVLFQDGAFDSLAEQLVGSQESLVFPKCMRASRRLNDNDPIVQKGKSTIGVLDIDPSNFSDCVYDKAIGPLQITHGDVARACGYCGSLSGYQQPEVHWSKAYEDRAFRWLLGTKGRPVDVPNLLYIRHAEKGRYRSRSAFSLLRKKIRQLQFLILGR